MKKERITIDTMKSKTGIKYTTTKQNCQSYKITKKTEPMDSRTKKTLPNEQLKISIVQFLKHEINKIKEHNLNSNIEFSKNKKTGQKKLDSKTAIVNEMPQ